MSQVSPDIFGSKDISIMSYAHDNKDDKDISICLSENNNITGK